MCGTFKPTNVISLSYQVAEAAYSQFYAERQCQEYMKLSLQGTSIFFSSGDVGVVSRFGVDGCLNGNQYNPGFPSTCPYVTSVGATQVSFR
jgi:tripeptidyl-peptidase-1